MVIQNSVTLSELDIVKQRYMSQESRLYYLFKVRVYLVASIQFVISLLPFLKFINLNYIVVMQMAVFIAVFVLAIHEYFFGAVTFILTMFKPLIVTSTEYGLLDISNKKLL